MCKCLREKINSFIEIIVVYAYEGYIKIRGRDNAMSINS